MDAELYARRKVSPYKKAVSLWELHLRGITSHTKSCLNTTLKSEVKAEGRGQKGLSLIKTLSRKVYFERGSPKGYPRMVQQFHRAQGRMPQSALVRALPHKRGCGSGQRLPRY